jgi:hypothetical protein
MHVKELLHKLLSDVIHQARLKTLSLVVSGVMQNKKISITELGRGIVGDKQERSGIRQADRLVGNKNLHAERETIYQEMVNLLIGRKKCVDIIVDWSQVPNTTHHILRASLAAKGRALTLYEKVHSEKKLGNARVQHKFLKRLKSLLPENCKPLIITDAGFHISWFEQILDFGWDFLGRIRGTYKYREIQGEHWQKCRNLYTKAKLVAVSCGKVLLSEKSALPSYLYLVKEKSKGRKVKTRTGKKKCNSQTKDYSRTGKEPWLLASSIKGTGYLKALRVINKYKLRMQIEEGFRDLKSSRYGLSFEYAWSRNISRIENLLLIATLTCLIAWLIGWFGETHGLHRQFQGNSIKNRRVLSLFFLGCRLTIKKIQINLNDFFSFIYGNLEHHGI